MKKFTSVSLLLIVGCGNTSVGGSARQKCRDAGFVDSTIDTFFVTADAIRDDGYSKLESLNDAQTSCLAICTTFDCAASCQACISAIIDETYP